MMWKEIVSSDDNRYRVTLVLANLGWWGTAAIVVLRAVDVIPDDLGLAAVLTIGAAVAASIALSRMRLAKTITTVFQAGMTSAVALSANILTDTCMVALDDQGIIESADHADAIGWEEEEIVGRELRGVLAPRTGNLINRISPGATLTSPMHTQNGGIFDAKISVVDLNGHTVATIAAIAAESSMDNPQSRPSLGEHVQVESEGKYR